MVEVRMRVWVLSLGLSAAVLFPIVGNAQVYPLRTAPPEVTAATAEWQITGDPIMVNSAVYLPTRAVRLFEGQVMTQVGVHEGVPVYADVTLEPNSIVYVPIGGNRMRTYERRRDRELAGTTGSRAPSFPVEIPTASPVEEQVVGTTGGVVPTAAGPAVIPGPSPLTPSRARRTTTETIPPPRTSNGVWVEFAGKRWYGAGGATSYSADRFTKIGEYRGFPVYRDKVGNTDEIWVPVVQGGLLTPYSKR
jgi:hypothetical protein